MIILTGFEGLILKQINYKESSKILYIYTPEGLISLLVHGAKKLSSPFLRATESLNFIRGYYTGKGLKTLTDAEIIQDYQSIKNDLNKVTYVSHLMELLASFAESEYDHKKLYDFVIRLLDKISDASAYIRYIYMFELKFLYMLGISPNFKNCVECSSTDNLRFSVKSGGFCCEKHFPAADKIYSDEAISIISKLFYHDLNQPLEVIINQSVGKEIRLILDDYYLFHLGFQSKSRKVLNGLLGY